MRISMHRLHARVARARMTETSLGVLRGESTMPQSRYTLLALAVVQVSTNVIGRKGALTFVGRAARKTSTAAHRRKDAHDIEVHDCRPHTRQLEAADLHQAHMRTPLQHIARMHTTAAREPHAIPCPRHPCEARSSASPPAARRSQSTRTAAAAPAHNRTAQAEQRLQRTTRDSPIETATADSPLCFKQSRVGASVRVRWRTCEVL